MAVECDVGVGEVVDEQAVALAGEIDELLHLRSRRDARGRVVRERDDDDLRPVGDDRLGDRVDASLGGRRDDACAGERRRDPMDRVRRSRHDDRVAVGHEHPHQVRQPLLRPDAGAA